MRTTLHLDDDVYEAASSLAATEGTSVGKVISRLARRGLAPPSTGEPSRVAQRGAASCCYREAIAGSAPPAAGVGRGISRFFHSLYTAG
jgi:hypothetical protein